MVARRGGAREVARPHDLPATDQTHGTDDAVSEPSALAAEPTRPEIAVMLPR